MRTLLTASLLALSLPLAAQPYGASNTEGLLLQIGLDGQGLVIDDDGSDVEVEGGTVSLRAGYGFSPVFTLYAGAAGGRVEIDGRDEVDFGAGEIGGRFNLNAGHALRPYLDVALRGTVLQDDDRDLELRGGGLTAGLGVAYFLSPTVALDAAVHLGGGRFDEVQVGNVTLDITDEEVDFGEGRLSVGLTAYPFRARGHDRGRRGRRGGRHGDRW